MCFTRPRHSGRSRFGGLIPEPPPLPRLGRCVATCGESLQAPMMQQSKSVCVGGQNGELRCAIAGCSQRCRKGTPLHVDASEGPVEGPSQGERAAPNGKFYYHRADIQHALETAAGRFTAAGVSAAVSAARMSKRPEPVGRTFTCHLSF